MTMEIRSDDHCDYLNAMTITKLCLSHSLDSAMQYGRDYKAHFTDFDPYILYACTHNNYHAIQSILNQGVGYLYLLCYKIACYHGHLKIMDLLMKWMLDSGNMSDFSPCFGVFPSQMIDNNPQTIELILNHLFQTQEQERLSEIQKELHWTLELTGQLNQHHDPNQTMIPVISSSIDLLSGEYERSYRDASRWMLQIVYFLLEGGHLNQIDLTTGESTNRSDI